MGELSEREVTSPSNLKVVRVMFIQTIIKKIGTKCTHALYIHVQYSPLIRPLPPKATPVIGPDFRYTEIVKYQ